MASDDKSLGADVKRHSPLPSDAQESCLFFGDRHTTSSETASKLGLVFVAPKESKNARTDPAQEGAITLSSIPNPQLDELWKKAESVMAARKSSVREVMEEFGIADVPPVTDELEEQLWQVVEGELTLQEAADLV